MIGALVGIVFGLSFLRQCDNNDFTELDMFHSLAVICLNAGGICCCKYDLLISQKGHMITFIELYHVQCDKTPAKKSQNSGQYNIYLRSWVAITSWRDIPPSLPPNNLLPELHSRKKNRSKSLSLWVISCKTWTEKRNIHHPRDAIARS